MFCLSLVDILLSILVEPHLLNCLKGDQTRYCNFHSIWILLNEVFLSQLVSFSDILKHVCSEIYLIAQKLIAEKALNYHLPADQIKQILYELFVELDGHLPEVNPSRK
jgi:hypothetical protein